MNKKALGGEIIICLGIFILGLSIGWLLLSSTEIQTKYINQTQIEYINQSCNQEFDSKLLIDMNNNLNVKIAELVAQAYQNGYNSKTCYNTCESQNHEEPVIRSNCIKGQKVSLSLIQKYMGSLCSFPDWCGCADINQDGIVNSGDYILLK